MLTTSKIRAKNFDGAKYACPADTADLLGTSIAMRLLVNDNDLCELVDAVLVSPNVLEILMLL